MLTIKKIIHIDMDAFFASIEQRDNPELKGRPVIVGGSPDSRGVVAACSYEARKYGIHSAMPSAKAGRICPEAVIINPRFETYRKVSRQIFSVLRKYSDIVENVSIDEAYLDVTGNDPQKVMAVGIARKIKDDIFKQTGLTASAGVSFNKFLAKVASDYQKPDGLTVITPERAIEFLDSLPVGKFHGIGKATEKKFHELGVFTGRDLRALNLEILVKHFKNTGYFFYDIVRAKDNRPVITEHERKSIGKERTFSRDIQDKSDMINTLNEISCEIESSLNKYESIAKKVTLKVRYSDFITVTRGLSITEPVCRADQIMKYVKILLNRTEAGRRKVRLLGISVSGLDKRSSIQEKQKEFIFSPV